MLVLEGRPVTLVSSVPYSAKWLLDIDRGQGNANSPPPLQDVKTPRLSSHPHLSTDTSLRLQMKLGRVSGSPNLAVGSCASAANDLRRVGELHLAECDEYLSQAGSC